jgi:2-keto-3-deoxy-L-rhamnonate aldolase RhmA
MIMALRAEGAAALVRVPELSKGAVQHALDAGAAGIVVPQVESVEEARMAARAVYYAPQGSRGAAAAVIAATGYGRDPGYLAEWNARGLLAVQIESREGLARVDEIAAVEGVDMLFFGPFDYAQDAGLDPSADAPALAEVFARIVEAARGADCLAGVFPWPGIGGEALSDMGADAIARASDIAVLRQGMSAALGHH